MRRDFLGYLTSSAAEHGDVFVIRPTPTTRIVVLNSAKLAHEVTTSRAAEFQKSAQTRYMVGKFLGNGLVLSESDTHAAQKRLLLPSFGARGVQPVAAAARRRTEELLVRSGEGVVDVEPAMTTLSMAVILEFLVGAPSEQDAAGRAFRTLAEAIGGRFKAMPLPAWMPTARNRREAAAVRDVGILVRDLLAASRATGHERPTVLSVLGRALDEGEQSEGEVRDQIITLLFAGHETVAKALSWTLLLLARHPGVQAKAREEARGGADLPRLRYLAAVVKESMRLYPPVWVFDRSPLRETELGGLVVGPKDVIYVSPYLLHGDARSFARPQEFDPSRFEGSPTFPEGAYMPFGAGPRACIGQSLALAETLAVLATVLASHEIIDAGTGEVLPRPDATLAPAAPIRLTFRPLEPELARDVPPRHDLEVRPRRVVRVVVDHDHPVP